MLRLLVTGLILACAFVAAALVWQFYVTAPWTRDGRVRVQVASVAPQVSGQITELRVADNQTVKKGDILYVIDPFDFEVSVTSAEAELDNREADLQVKRTQAARREALTTLSTSVEEKQQYAGTAKIAEAAVASAKAQLSQAKTNLQRTQVRVAGERPGDEPAAARRRLCHHRHRSTSPSSTRDSFWIDGYFEETKMAHIHVGDPVSAELLGYDPLIRGTVESITLGISTANAAASTQGLPNVDPVYTWVRLAQRVPVRIRIERGARGRAPWSPA